MAIRSDKLNIVPIDHIEDYKIVRMIEDRGGEADIYVVEKQGIEYALKLYRYGFIPEFSVIQKIKEITIKYYQNLVKIIDYGHDETSDRFYEIMEYSRFGNLRKIKMSNENIDTIIFQINDGLKKLHNENIIHLDLKPENILIREKEPLDIILTDFGISTKIDKNQSIKESPVQGTNIYLAPEVKAGNLSRKSDFWSFGMIVLELLLNSTSFKDYNRKINKQSDSRIEIPEKLDFKYRKLLRGLLEKDTESRWGIEEVDRWFEKKDDIVYTGEKESILSLYKNGESKKSEKAISNINNTKIRYELYASIILDRINTGNIGFIEKYFKSDILHDRELYQTLYIDKDKIKLNAKETLANFLFNKRSEFNIIVFTMILLSFISVYFIKSTENTDLLSIARFSTCIAIFVFSKKIWKFAALSILLIPTMFIENIFLSSIIFWFSASCIQDCNPENKTYEKILYMIAGVLPSIVFSVGKMSINFELSFIPTLLIVFLTIFISNVLMFSTIELIRNIRLVDKLNKFIEIYDEELMSKKKKYHKKRFTKKEK